MGAGRGGSLGLALLLAVVGPLAGGGGFATAGQATPVATPAVVREVLQAGMPAAAPGQVLELVRYTIAPGTRLPAHTHPGMQAAYVESGTLAYTVLVGEVEIRRAGTAGTPGPVEVLRPGREALIYPGDGFVEAPGLVHFGRNPGPGPLVILVASLFEAGQPPSHPWTPPATPEA
jgi:mannose-6-phosphate isomerase-like protein (cupin superfamily)